MTTFAPPAYPLTREMREWLRDLYAYRAAHLHLSGVPLEEARADAKALARSFAAEFRVGHLVLMEPNVITRELAAGVTPEEWQQ